ncbi:MAG TPA: glucose 1-dehydrogenase [Myxococcota bacterium]|nr:glucose 1-dehydrogenase [Myxococcota bacterium]
MTRPPDEERLLDGRVAVVTGGGAGIGAAVARRFAEHGAAVEIAEIDASRADEALRAIRAAGGEARASTVDVREADAVRAFARDVLARRGRVDVLVNNVGDFLRAVPFSRSDPAHWDALYRVNLHHVFLVTHAFVPSMIERRSGVIINVSSVEGLRGYPADPVYGAFKAAVVHFTRCLALELGRRGIRVNGVAPDLTQTPQVDYRALAAPGDEAMWESWAPVGRVAEPEEQADAVLFLASDLSRFVTGHTLPTDGGTLAGGGWFWSPADRRWTNRPKRP